MTVGGEALRGRRIVVTGATGFVGSAFVRHAVAGGARVTVIARATSDHWRLEPVQGRYATVTNPIEVAGGLLEAEGATAELFVHFAAAGVNQTFDDVDAMVATNVTGTLHALHAATRLGVSRFVLVGTSGEYGPGVSIAEDAPLRPTSEYGATRASATLLAQAYGGRRGLDVVVVRPFAVYGPYEAAYRLVPYCIVRGLRGEPMSLSSGVQTRDYVHVDDVARGIERACVVAAARSGVFNLCSGVEASVADAARLVARLCGGRSAIETGTRPAIPGEMWRTTGSPRRAHDVLGWSATHSLEEGLDRTIGWFRDGALALPEYRGGA